MDIGELCDRYAENRELAGKGKIDATLTSWFENRTYDPSFEEEMKARKFFSEDEMNLIAEQAVQMGMREEVIRCIFGRPSAANSSVGSWGTHTQYVFREFGWYVYVENGIVTSWQN